MGKLRRIAEVGDGTFEQLMNKQVALENDVVKAERRKKKYVSAQKADPQPDTSMWEQLKGALRVDQRGFSPTDVDDFNEQKYTGYDMHGRSIRRAMDAEPGDESTYDPRTAMGFHMYDDPTAVIEEMLMEDMQGHVMAEEAAKGREVLKMEASQGWDEEANAWAQARLKGRNDEAISASQSRGSIFRTATENVTDSAFGQMNYDNAAAREQRKQEMIEAMKTRHKSISRPTATKEERTSQMFNQETIRSQSVQKKMESSKLMNKLSDLLNK